MKKFSLSINQATSLFQFIPPSIKINIAAGRNKRRSVMIGNTRGATTTPLSGQCFLFCKGPKYSPLFKEFYQVQHQTRIVDRHRVILL